MESSVSNAALIFVVGGDIWLLWLSVAAHVNWLLVLRVSWIHSIMAHSWGQWSKLTLCQGNIDALSERWYFKPASLSEWAVSGTCISKFNVPKICIYRHDVKSIVFSSSVRIISEYELTYMYKKARQSLPYFWHFMSLCPSMCTDQSDLLTHI